MSAEQAARQTIDTLLAQAGWAVQDFKQADIYPARRVATSGLVPAKRCRLAQKLADRRYDDVPAYLGAAFGKRYHLAGYHGDCRRDCHYSVAYPVQVTTSVRAVKSRGSLDRVYRRGRRTVHEREEGFLSSRRDAVFGGRLVRFFRQRRSSSRFSLRSCRCAGQLLTECCYGRL